MAELQVLIVDDEEELVTTIAERLKLRGIHAQTANDAENALKIIELNPPNVIVLEISLPGMSSTEFLQQMKVRNFHIPVILLTSYGPSEKGPEGIRQGANDFVMKPCDLNVLISKILEAAKIQK